MKRLILITFLSLSSFAYSSTYSTKPVEGIPTRWVETKGDDVLRYANYIKSLNLKHVTPYDVIYPCFKTHDGVSNSLPPRNKWKDIVPLLKTIDKLAADLKVDVKPFIRGYRSPKFNRAMKGRAKSVSLKNIAVRVAFDGVSPDKLAAAARKLRADGFFNGGVGVYKDSVHLDNRGVKVDW